MKYRPLGTKVCLKIERGNTKKVGDSDKVIHLVTEGEKLTRFFVESMGPDVMSDIKEGDEVRLFSNAHLNIHNTMQDTGVVDISDIWAVVEQ